MKNLTLAVTYQVWTQDDIEHGECSDSGFIIEPIEGLSLRECIEEVFKTRTNAVDGCSTHYEYNSFTVNNGLEYETGYCETRTLHITGATPASMKRLFKLIS